MHYAVACPGHTAKRAFYSGKILKDAQRDFFLKHQTGRDKYQ